MADAAKSDKPGLRIAALERRDVMPEQARVAASGRLAGRVVPMLRSLRPRIVGGYVAVASEADPSAIIRAAEADGARIALPAMTDSIAMVFRQYRSGEPLVPDVYRIPAPPPPAPTVDPDLLLVPVTAFDRAGTRIGKGRGVYDRAIAAMRDRGHVPILVGIAFSVQEVPAIPREAHDVGLDWIVTEDETLRFSAAS